MDLKLKQKTNDFAFHFENERSFICEMDAGNELGGKNQGFRPMEMLAGSLAGCLSIDLVHILRKQRIELSGLEVQIKTKRKDSVPSPFEKIELVFWIADAAIQEKVEKALKLSKEKYCSVSACLNQSIEIQILVKVK